MLCTYFLTQALVMLLLINLLSTGNAATSSLSGGNLSLDWRHVFDVTRDVTFSVFAGSEEGLGDVINHITTTSTQLTTFCPKSLTMIYVTVQAVYDNGLSTFYTDVINL